MNTISSETIRIFSLPQMAGPVFTILRENEKGRVCRYEIGQLSSILTL